MELDGPITPEPIGQVLPQEFRARVPLVDLMDSIELYGVHRA